MVAEGGSSHNGSLVCSGAQALPPLANWDRAPPKTKKIIMKKGRNKIPKNKPKTHQVKARFSEEDYKCVLKKATLAGMRPSVFVARAATSADIKEPLTKEMLFDIKNLGKIGINLNQIA